MSKMKCKNHLKKFKINKNHFAKISIKLPYRSKFGEPYLLKSTLLYHLSTSRNKPNPTVVIQINECQKPSGMDVN